MSDGNLIGNNKLIEKMTSTPFEISTLDLTPTVFTDPPTTVYMLYNKCEPSTGLLVHRFQIILKACFQKWYVIES